ncbi:peptidoglycan-binding protein [Streptomyces sp. NPDC056411]|uniref:peptidoglycan-binding protein n=1 Tax=Streptomyces sp. NPDC056411 TaxID=3345813 RepID=UPI0035DED04E
MSRWRGLPESLDQRVRQLVVQLRRLKDHSGLSLASLAAKTAYSKSSWERYLNGKKLPPRDAVEALARVCGADPTRLLALHEVAAQAWETERPAPAAGPAASPVTSAGDGPSAEDGPASGGGPSAGPPAGPVPAPEVAPAPGGRTAARPRTGPLVALGALAVLAVAVAVLLTVRPWQHQAAPARGTGAATGTQLPAAVPSFTHRVGETFACRVRRTAHGLYAGRSRTATAIVGSGSIGWDVVEAQCLLHHRGYDPGPVDGVAGENTRRAVKRLQAGAGLPTDGVVGPDTWKALRR